MMRKRLIAIALMTCFAPAIAQQPSDAQSAAVQAAIGACSANPGACAVVGAAAGTWLLWNNGTKLLCTYATCINNPDEPYHGQIIDYVWGNTKPQAIARCQEIARRADLRYVTVRQTSKNGKRWECHVDNL